MIDIILLLKKTKVTKSEKPWLTSSIKELIIKRHKPPLLWENSDAYKLWRNQVSMQSIKSARVKYYAQSVEKLKTSNPSRWLKEISCWVVYILKLLVQLTTF